MRAVKAFDLTRVRQRGGVWSRQKELEESFDQGMRVLGRGTPVSLRKSLDAAKII